MTRLIPVWILAVVMGGTALGQNRIATVDLQKVFDKYWKTGQMSSALKDQVDELTKTHEQMVKDYQKQKEAYQKLVEEANNQAVSGAERERRKKEAENKLGELQDSKDSIDRFDRQADAKVSEKKAQMRRSLLADIRLAIDSKARAGGYSLVLDSSAQTYVPDPSGPYTTPNVLYWSRTNDLTATVIAQLNAGAPIGTPKSSTNSSGEDMDGQ